MWCVGSGGEGEEEEEEEEENRDSSAYQAQKEEEEEDGEEGDEDDEEEDEDETSVSKENIFEEVCFTLSHWLHTSYFIFRWGGRRVEKESCTSLVKNPFFKCQVILVIFKEMTRSQ